MWTAMLCVGVWMETAAQQPTQQSETTIQLNEVVVTGTGTAHSQKDAPVQTEVISGATLRQYAGRNVEDVLSGLSASLTVSSGDMGSNLQINGLKNDYILILIDGKRINGDVGGQNDLSRINLQNVERIELVKGAVSSLYGSDAIGGVINFIMKKNRDKLQVSNSTRVGSYGEINQHNDVGFQHGKLNSLTSFAFKHTDGWRNTTQEWYRGTLYENSVTKTANKSSNYTVAQEFTYTPSKQLQLTASASYYEKWTNRPTGVPQLRRTDFYYRNQSYGTGARYNLRGRNYLTADVSFDKYDYYYDYTSREYSEYFDDNGDRIIYFTGDRVLQTSQRRLLGNVKGVFYLSSQHTLSAGVEYIWDKLVSPFRLSNDKATAYSLSGYVQEEWNITKQFNITAGLRVGKHRTFGQTITPKISALYKLGKFDLRATYSNGYKAPTIKELYYHYYATIMSKYKAYYGNADLKPQKSNYYSVGLTYHAPNVKLSLTGYHNSIRHMIALRTIDTSYEDRQLLIEETMKYLNLSKGRTYGLDVSVEVSLPYRIKLGGSYALLSAKEQRSDDETAEDYMKYRPINATSRHNVSVKASWDTQIEKYKLGITLTGRYQSRRFYLTDGDAKGYQLWRLNTSHSILDTKRWKLNANAGVDNLFNYIDRTPFGYNRGTTSPGRTVYAGVTLKFQRNPLK